MLRKDKRCDTPGLFIRLWPWLAIGAVILFTGLIRLRLLQTPFERDEGEFAYMGRLILQGIPPYKLAYSMKLPGIYAIYALIMLVFGQTIAGARLGLLCTNAITIILVFILAKRFLGRLAGVIAGISFALLSLSPWFLGTFGHATHFVLPFALGGILLMLRGAESGRLSVLFLAGILLGMGFLMKQHAVFFIVFSAAYLFWITRSRSPWRSSAVLLAGAAIPFALTCLLMAAAGVFDRFWFWTFVYAHEYTSNTSLADGLRNLALPGMYIVKRFWGYIALAGIGIIALFADKEFRKHRPFVLTFLAFSFLTVCPGLHFRAHYFVLTLPVMALLIAAGVCWMCRLLGKGRIVRGLPVLLFLGLSFSIVWLDRSFFFRMSPTDASWWLYAHNAFPTSLPISEYIKDRTSASDTVAVLGSEPQIYFYAERHSATGYIYMFGLMEKHKYALRMQQEMAGQIEAARPKYVVGYQIPESWPTDELQTFISDWAVSYVAHDYRLVGIVDVLGDCSVVKWDAEVEDYQPISPNVIYVFERKPGM